MRKTDLKLMICSTWSMVVEGERIVEFSNEHRQRGFLFDFQFCHEMIQTWDFLCT
jgi:hypothetical protein